MAVILTSAQNLTHARMESHPDCPRCANRGKLFSPRDLMELLGPSPQADRPELPEAVVLAGAEVDRLVEQADVATALMGEAMTEVRRLRFLKDPAALTAANRRLQGVTTAREQVLEELQAARVAYNRLRQTESLRRIDAGYRADLAAQAAQGGPVDTEAVTEARASILERLGAGTKGRGK